MDFLLLFNVMLLSLSIATILLTLISYFLYKLRQLPGPNSRMLSGRKMTGVFFKRYYPTEARRKSESPLSSPTGASSLFGDTHRGVLFFGLAVLVVATALLLQNYVAQLRRQPPRAASAKKYKELVKLGLLKNYDFSEMDAKASAQEFVPENDRRAQTSLIGKLAKKRVLLLDRWTGDPKAGSGGIRASQAWRGFLKKNKISFHAVALLNDELTTYDLILVPQAERLTLPERERLGKMISAGTSVFATGYLGPDQNWNRDFFGVEFETNENDRYFPSLFAAPAEVLWQVPPGWLAEWGPMQNHYSARGKKGATAIFESNYLGELRRGEGSHGEREEISRGQFVEHGAARTVWFALDPMEKPADAAEDFFSQNCIASAMAWTAGIPLAQPALWKQGATAASVLFVDSEDGFENVEGFISQFSTYRVPATFFAVSSLLQSFPQMASKLGEGLELASHSDRHQVFEGEMPQAQFEAIQNSRLDIEEISVKPVRGFRPPFEKFDDNTIHAAAQNRLRYFMGDRRHFRFAPLWLASGQLMYFPRSVADDFALEKRRSLGDAHAIADAIIQDFDRITRARGLFLFGMHTQIFGRSDYRPALAEFLKYVSTQKVWTTNFDEVSRWWEDRGRLTTRIEEAKDGRRQLTVSNEGERSLDATVIEIESGGSDAYRVEEKNTDRTLASVPDYPLMTKPFRLTVDRLGPNQTRTFVLSPAKRP